MTPPSLLDAWRSRYPHRDFPTAVTQPGRKDAAARAGQLIQWGEGPLVRLAAWTGPMLYVVAPVPIDCADLDAMHPLEREDVMSAFDAHLVRDLPAHLKPRCWDWDRTEGQAGHHLNLLLSKDALGVWGDCCPNCSSPLTLLGPEGRRPSWALRCAHCNFFAEPVGERERDLWGLARYFTEPHDDRAGMGDVKRRAAAEAHLAERALLRQAGRRFIPKRGFRDLPRGWPGDCPRPSPPEVTLHVGGWTWDVAVVALFLTLWQMALWAVRWEEAEERRSVFRQRPLARPRPRCPQPRRGVMPPACRHRGARAGPNERR